MALRLRRGTDAERQLITPLEGELIYTTDTKILYIGDGVTQGGIRVTGTIPQSISDLNDVDLSNSPTLGQTLKWNGVAFVPADDENTGVIEGSNYRINIAADDSTIMVDTVTNTFTGNFVGDGSGITNLDLSTNSIFDLDNVFTFTPPDIGDLLIYDGFNFRPQKIQQIEGDDSSIMLDTSTNSFFGNFVGDFAGDVSGSIFSNDSTLLVDGISKNIVGQINSTQTLKTTIPSNINGDSLHMYLYAGDIETPQEPENFDSQKIKFSSWRASANDYVTTALFSAYHQTNGGGYIGISAANSSDTFFNTAIEMDGVNETLLIISPNGTTINGSLSINGGITGDITGSLFSDNSTQIIDGVTGELVNLNIRGNTSDVPVDPINIDSWLEIIVNGSTRFIPLYS